MGGPCCSRATRSSRAPAFEPIEHEPPATPLPPLHHPVANDRLELVDRFGELPLPRRAVGLELVALLEVAERLLEVAAQARGDGQVVEARTLLPLPAERHPGQALRLVEVGVDRDGALEL